MAKSTPSFLRRVGPGVVTGAADDDPSGITTYTQAGAQFGTGLLWTVFLSLPFMIAIQLVSARIGRVTGKGVAANLRDHTPRSFLMTMVFLLVVANTINIAADIAAMGEALQLVVGRWRALSCGGVWCADGVAAGVCALSQAGTHFEMAHAVFVRLRHRCVCGRRALGPRAA